MKSPAVFSDFVARLKNWFGPLSRTDSRNCDQSGDRVALWQDVVNSLAPERPDASGQRHDAFDDRRMPRAANNLADQQRQRREHLRIIKGKVTPTALALLVELDLKQAVAVIQALPDTVPNIANLEVQRRAFKRIYAHLGQQPSAFADQIPLVTLLASRLSHIEDPVHQALVLDLIAHYSQSVLQINLLELVTTQLCALPPLMQQRTLDMLEAFLRISADLPLTQIDILLGLTRAVASDCCRQRASALVAEGLKNLRGEPEVCAQIRHQLTLSYCAAGQNLQLQA